MNIRRHYREDDRSSLGLTTQPLKSNYGETPRISCNVQIEIFFPSNAEHLYRPSTY